MKLTPEELQENAVNLLSAAMTNPLDRNWLRKVVQSVNQAPNINLEAAYRTAAQLAKERDVETPSLEALLKGA
jgi:hypothetical protein